MVDTFASPDARYNFSLLAVPLSRNYDCDGLTNRLFGSVTEDTLGTPIPASDNAVEVLAYNSLRHWARRWTLASAIAVHFREDQLRSACAQ